MSDAGKINTNPKAIAAIVANLRDGQALLSSGRSSLAAFLEALSAERGQLSARLAACERERDEAKNNILAWSDAHADMEASRDAALSELAKLRAAEAHPDATARAVEAFTALRWYRPHSLIAAPEATPIVALFQHGDVRCVFVNEGDWIMVEMAIAALPSPPKDPAHD